MRLYGRMRSRNSWMQLKDKNGKPLVLGHRGYIKAATENTIKSYEAALNAGADGIELDVHATKDNRLVILHDFNTKRVYSQDLDIESSTLDEIKAVSEAIPTLSEVFDALGPIFYDIELKGNMKFNKALVHLVNEELAKRKEIQDRVMVSSFNPLIMRAFSKAMSYDYPLLPIYDTTPAVPFFLHHGEGRLFFKAAGLKPRADIAIKEKNKSNYPIVPWTVDDEKSLQAAIDIKAPILITNESELIIKALQERSLH